MVVLRSLLRIFLAYVVEVGGVAGFHAIEEYVRADNNQFVSMMWDVIVCLGGLVMFHDGVRRADVAHISLARKTLYPVLFAFHRTNYAHLVSQDEGFVQWARSNVSNDYLEQRRKAAYVSPSGLNYLYQGDDANPNDLRLPKR